jgi:hypothetical protein
MLIVRSKLKDERAYLFITRYLLLCRDFFSRVMADVISERAEKGFRSNIFTSSSSNKRVAFNPKKLYAE